MATGPVTLLVDPVNQTYIDADGEHALPWHEIPMVKPRVTMGATHLPILPAESWAYSARNKPDANGTPVMLVNTLSPHSSTAQAMYTVTNATKTNVPMAQAFTYLEGADFDLSEQQFWHLLGSQNAHGSGHSGSFFCIKLVSTGGDVSLTLAANAGLYSSNFFEWTAIAVVVNANAVERDIRFIADGAESNYTVPPTLEASSYQTVRGYGDTDFDATDALGIRFLDTLAGETFYVLMYGIVGDYNGNPATPIVHTTSSDIPNTLYYDPNAIGTITPFSGTAYLSQGRMGETFWRVPITPDHIPDDTEFAIASRSHPFWLPFMTASYYWTMTRMAATYTDAEGGFSFGIKQDQLTWDVYEDSRLSVNLTKTAGEIVNTQIVTGLPNPRRQIEPFTPVVSLRDGRLRVRMADDDSGWLTLLKPPPSGWMALDDDELEEVLLLPGGPMTAYEGSYVMQREQAIFSRDLTDAEYAFLSDADSVWSFNMFAPPTQATVTGLDAPIYRGDDREVTVTITDADGDPVPLYGHTVWFTGKTDLPSDDDDGAVLKCSAEIGPDGAEVDGLGVQLIDAAAGAVTFTFQVPQTSAMVTYDVQVQDINGRIATLLVGHFIPANDVTIRASMP